MVFHSISKDIKEQALWLLGEDFIDEDIAALLGVSTRSIRQWEDNFEQYGSVIPPQILPRGRPSVMSTAVREDLIALSAESPELFLDEIQDWIAITHGTAISRSQLCQIIKDCAISYKRLRRAAAEHDEDLVTEWRQVYQKSYTAAQILWIDETSKDDRTVYRHFGHSIIGTHAIIPANFIRGVQYSLVAALGLGGYAASRVVHGSVTGDEFFDFIVVDVVSTFLPVQY